MSFSFSFKHFWRKVLQQIQIDCNTKYERKCKVNLQLTFIFNNSHYNVLFKLFLRTSLTLITVITTACASLERMGAQYKYDLSF